MTDKTLETILDIEKKAADIIKAAKLEATHNLNQAKNNQAQELNNLVKAGQKEKDLALAASQVDLASQAEQIKQSSQKDQSNLEKVAQKNLVQAKEELLKCL